MLAGVVFTVLIVAMILTLVTGGFLSTTTGTIAGFIAIVAAVAIVAIIVILFLVVLGIIILI